MRINNLNEIDVAFNPTVERNHLIQPNVLVMGMREQFALGAAILKTIGFPHTGNTMLHSAQDNPPNLFFQSNTSISRDIRNTSIFERKLNEFISEMPKYGSYYSKTDSFSLTANNSSRDLYLSLHKVSYHVAAQKDDRGKWTIYSNIRDDYDFQHWNKDQAPNAFVRLANNYGSKAMELGAINPYKINVYIVNVR